MKRRILCFGDSNTWGAIPAKEGRYPEDVRWTGILQRELGNEYTVLEAGYNGRTTVFDDSIEGRMAGIRFFPQCLASQLPLDLLILALGTNDLKTRFGSDARSIAYGLMRYRDALTTAPQVGNKPLVLLVSPILIDPAYKDDILFHDMFGEYAVERSASMATAYQDMAQELGWLFIDSAQYAKASVTDGIHMEPESHNSLGRAIASMIKNTFNESNTEKG